MRFFVLFCFVGLGLRCWVVGRGVVVSFTGFGVGVGVEGREGVGGKGKGVYNYCVIISPNTSFSRWHRYYCSGNSLLQLQWIGE